MSDQIESYAWISVARGCGFAALGTVTTMVGLSGYPAVAFRFGAHAFLLTSFILILMAVRAPQRHYKRTETWLLLDEDLRPPVAIAQKVIGVARREALVLFARLHAALALALFIVALLSRALTG